MANFTSALQESINKLLLEADKLGDYTEIPAGDGFFSSFGSTQLSFAK